MVQRMRFLLAAVLLASLPVTGHAALTAYTQDFEALVKTSPTALSGNGWVIFGNVYSPDRSIYFYGYGTFPAPNGGNAFSAIVDLQGGVPQGNQQLSIYNDYNNLDHAIGRLIEANVFREQTIAAADVGDTWTFQFDAKLGNLVSPSTAAGFIKTLNPAAGFATTNFLTVNTTSIPATWGTYSVSLTITPDLVGQLLQFGFLCTASNYQASGVFYDNVSFTRTATTGVVAPLSGLALSAVSPNPFRGSARLDFSLPARGYADVGVYDVTGRRVATLFRGESEAGVRSLVWDGRLADGRPAAAGVYHAALEASGRRVMRRMVLTR